MMFITTCNGNLVVFGLYASGFLNVILYEFIMSLMQATCPAYLIVLDLINLINIW